MASQGARVALLDLDGAEAEKTAAALPTPGLAVACDAAVEADTTKAVTTVAERLGGLDILVNNAGVGRGPRDPNVPRAPGSVGSEGLSAAAWDEYLSQNLRTTFVAHESGAAAPEGARRRRDRQHLVHRRPRRVARGCRPTRRRRRA